MNQQFIGVQMLRFVAAMMVVAMHTTQAISMHITGAGGLVYWGTGSAGVDIFFVISGFVMSLSVSRWTTPSGERLKSGWMFLKRRLLRILPLYWFYTLAKVLILIAVPTLAARSSIDFSHVGYSLFFIPALSPWGLIEPTLPVGWTLNFEMLFYLIFALALVLGAPRIKFCVLVFAIFFLGAKYIPSSTALAFYAQTIVFEFVFGMCIAHAFFVKPGSRSWWIGVIGLAVASIWMFGVTWNDATDRLIRWGVPATLMVASVIWLEPHIAHFKNGKHLSFLGDASYSIYLSHTFAVPAAVLALRKMGLSDTSLVFVLVMSIALVAGCFSYLAVERPMTYFFKRLFFGKGNAAYTQPKISHAE